MSLINQALSFKEMGRIQEGLALAEEANLLATQNGFASLAKIASILNSLRQTAQQ